MSNALQLHFYLHDWAAWLPGVESREEWLKWSHDLQCGEAKPISLTHIPAANRRRLSQLGKMLIATALRICPLDKHVPVIYASQFGDIVRSESLLEDLSQDLPLSPNSFSMSVQNSTIGLLSIMSGNKQPMTAISAGEHSFEAALIEAVSQLKYHTHPEVLLLIGDETPGPYFQSLMHMSNPPFALALLLSLNAADGGQGIAYTINTEQAAQTPPEALHPALAFIRSILNRTIESD